MVPLPAGPFDPVSLTTADSITGPFGAFVLTGLLARDVVLADRVATQLVGAGDVISLGVPVEATPPTRSAWRVILPSDVAILDGRFLAAAQQWPWLTARMVQRAARWADRAAALQAITQLGRVDLRLLGVLWHLAERWGRVGTDGVIVDLRLTHETLGHLVGAQRPTVTLALRELREQGLVERRGAGWLLASESLLLLEPQVAPHERLSGEGGIRTLERG